MMASSTKVEVAIVVSGTGKEIDGKAAYRPVRTGHQQHHSHDPHPGEMA